MHGQDPKKNASLLRSVGLALGMNAQELAKVLETSRRSVSRWTLEGTWLSTDDASRLAKLVHRRDRALAASVAQTAGLTLADLGLEARAPSPAMAAKYLDAVVCAAAEAMDTSPRAVRPALLAALRCAKEAGLTLEAMEAMLEAGLAAKKAASGASASKKQA